VSHCTISLSLSLHARFADVCVHALNLTLTRFSAAQTHWLGQFLPLPPATLSPAVSFAPPTQSSAGIIHIHTYYVKVQAPHANGDHIAKSHTCRLTHCFASAYTCLSLSGPSPPSPPSRPCSPPPLKLKTRTLPARKIMPPPPPPQTPHWTPCAPPAAAAIQSTPIIANVCMIQDIFWFGADLAPSPRKGKIHLSARQK
jgi:hypothetical protein